MKNISGQSLFEIIVAVAVVALITVAIVGLAIVSIRNSSFSEEKTSANFYTQEAVEWLRKYRDEEGWFYFTQKEGTWCFPTVAHNDWEANSEERVCNDTVEGDYISDTNYLREVSLESSVVPNTVNVNVAVYWEDSKGAHSTKVSTIFSKWEVAP